MSQRKIFINTLELVLDANINYSKLVIKIFIILVDFVKIKYYVICHQLMS